MVTTRVRFQSLHLNLITKLARALCSIKSFNRDINLVPHSRIVIHERKCRTCGYNLSGFRWQWCSEERDEWSFSIFLTLIFATKDITLHVICITQPQKLGLWTEVFYPCNTINTCALILKLDSSKARSVVSGPIHEIGMPGSNPRNLKLHSC